MLILAILLMLVAVPTVASTADEILPTYPAYYRFTKCGVLTKIMYTAKNRPGMVVIVVGTDNIESYDYLAAYQRAKKYKMVIRVSQPCE